MLRIKSNVQFTLYQMWNISNYSGGILKFRLLFLKPEASLGLLLVNSLTIAVILLLDLLFRAILRSRQCYRNAKFFIRVLIKVMSRLHQCILYFIFSHPSNIK